MTRLSETIDLGKRYRGEIARIRPGNISIIIPVKNNQEGIDRFLSVFFQTHDSNSYPNEIIIIDNNSNVPVRIDQNHLQKGLTIKLLSCSRPGPAAARNDGVRKASGEWLLFCDSDCIPTSTLLSGYINSTKTAIAYAGKVKSIPDSILARYYDSEEILLPYRKRSPVGDYVPLYVVTANALVWKPAFDACGRFAELFRHAGGEDVDLARRLWQIGNIEYEPNSVILHDFSDGFLGFCRRFSRYGRGNRQLEEATGISMQPKHRPPKARTTINSLLMAVQHTFLSIGYYREKYQSHIRSILKPSSR